MSKKKGRKKGQKNHGFNVPILPSLVGKEKDPFSSINYQNTVETVIRKIENGIFDLSPPYQRYSVWNLDYQAKLLFSVLSGITVSPIHISRSPYDNTSFYIIDGKQRCEALLSFKMGIIYLLINKDNGKCLKLDFETLMRSKDPEVVIYRNKWDDYNFTIEEHKIEEDNPTKILERHMQIFEYINYSKELSDQEQVLCPNFMARKLMTFLYEECFEKTGYDSMLKSELRSEGRMKGLAFLLGVVSTAFGQDLSDLKGFGIQGTGKNKLKISAEATHLLFWNNGIYANDKITKDILKDIKLEHVLERLKTVVRWFYDIINLENDIEKDLTKGILTDYFIFFFKKMEDSVLTDSVVYSNGILKRLNSWFIKSFEKREEYLKNEGNNDSCARKDALERRYEILKIEWDKCFPDIKKKNKSIPSSERRKALIKSGSHCEYSGARLNRKNNAVDHTLPRAYSSDTSYIVIGEMANSIKNAMNPDYADKYLKIVEEEKYISYIKDKKESVDKQVESNSIFD